MGQKTHRQRLHSIAIAGSLAVSSMLPTGCEKSPEIQPIPPAVHRNANPIRNVNRVKPNAPNAVRGIETAPKSSADIYNIAASISPTASFWPPVAAAEPETPEVKKDAKPSSPAAVTPADVSAAKRLTVSAPPATWKAPIDPAPAAARPLGTVPLRSIDNKVKEILFSAAATGRAIVLTTATTTYSFNDRERLRKSLPRDEYQIKVRSREFNHKHDRIDCFDIYKSEHLSTIRLSGAARLLDYSLDGNLVALQYVDRPNRIDIWSISEEKHVVGWEVVANGATETKLDKVRILNDRQVLTLTSNGQLTLWNVPDCKAVYRIEQAGPGPLEVTPGLRFAAIFTGETFRLFDAVTGRTIGSLAIPRKGRGVVQELAFNMAGNRLAAHIKYPGDYVVDWNLVNAQVGRVFPVPSIPQREERSLPVSRRGLHWCGENLLMLGDLLCDTSRGNVIWHYASGKETRPLYSSPDEQHWLLSRGMLTVTPVPHLELKPLIDRAPTPGQPVAGPGTTVSLKLDHGGSAADRATRDSDFSTDVVKLLAERLAANGYRCAPSQKTTLVVRATVEPTGETIQYRFEPNRFPGRSSAPMPSGQPDITVSLHRMTWEVAFVDAGGNTLWSRGQSVEDYAANTRYFKINAYTRATAEREDRKSLWRDIFKGIQSEAKLPTFLYAKPLATVVGKSIVEAPSRYDRSNNSTDLLASVPILEPFNFIAGHTSSTNGFQFSPADPNLIATCGSDLGSHDIPIKIWDLRKESLYGSLTYDGSIYCVALSPNGQRVAGGTSDGKIIVGSVKGSRRKNARILPSDKRNVTHIAWLPDSKHLVAGYDDGTVGHWSTTSKKDPAVIHQFSRRVNGLFVLPDGKSIIVSSDDRTVRKFNLETKSETLRIFERQFGYTPVELSPDGQTLAIVHHDGGALLFDTSTGKEKDRIALREEPESLAWSPDGQLLALGGSRGRISVWHIARGIPLCRLDGIERNVKHVDFSSDSKMLAASSFSFGSGDDIQLWNLAEIEIPDDPMAAAPPAE